MAHPDWRQCRTSSNDVSLPLKSYADLPPSGGTSAHRWAVSKMPVGGHQRPAVRRTGFMECRRDGDSLFRLDIQGSDDVAPLLRFFGDEPTRVGGRAPKRASS